jgi:hypothetical protein
MITAWLVLVTLKPVFNKPLHVNGFSKRSDALMRELKKVSDIGN